MRRHSGRVKKASSYGTAPIHNLFGSASEGVLSEPRAETHSLYTFTVSELITPGGEEACHWGYRGWDGPQRVVSDGDLVWGSIHVGSASVLFSSCAHTAQTPTASAALLVRSINSAIALSITCFIGAFMKVFSVRGRISWSGQGGDLPQMRFWEASSISDVCFLLRVREIVYIILQILGAMTLHTFYFPLDHKIHPSWPYFHCLPLYVLSAALFSANPRLTLPKIDIVCPEMRLPSIETCFVGCRQPLFLQHQRCRVRRQRRPRLWTSIYHWRNFDVEWATGLKKLKEFF